MVTVFMALFDELVRLKRVVFLSPYANFNLVFGLSLAKHLLKFLHSIYMFCEFDIPSSVLSILDESEIKRLYISKTVHNVNISNAEGVIMILDKEVNNMYRILRIDIKYLFIFIPRLKLIKDIHDMIIYRVRKASTGIYQFLTKERRYFVKVIGTQVIEVSIPHNLELIVVELNDIINTFGSIKASDFVKYCMRKMNLGREECVDLVRKAISMGIIKYRGGYLTLT